MQGPSIQRSVQVSRELTRILNLPRRAWSESDPTWIAFAHELTDAIKRPEGTMVLRPIQAMALLDAGTLFGLIALIEAGGGKTLISFLIPYVLKSRRPLLITRANLIDKTKREMRDLAWHWPIPNFIRIISYDILSRANHADLLEKYQPDCIIADEAHKLKNTKAAVTRRMARYMAKNPDTIFIPMSGTLTKRSLKDYAHLVAWALKPQNAPVPTTFSEIEDWAEATDEKPHLIGERKVQPGALLAFCTPEERRNPDLVAAARVGFGRRFNETPGVVASSDIQLGCSLTISALEVDMGPDIDQAFQILRDTWTTPDGWPISDPMSLWRHARELSLGFYYKWDPRPPDEWLNARKDWAAMCRYILSNNRRNLDSELQVLNAVDQGFYPEATPVLEAWRRVKGLFKPNTVPVWLDDSVIQACSRWAIESPGIVWTEHTAFAEKLARTSNLVYYGQNGQDSQGRPIESHDPKLSLIASEGSNREGRNLQAWNRNLITSCATSGEFLEQQLARTHRPGQLEDEVTADIILTSIEHATAFNQAQKDARRQSQLFHKKMRLLYADIIFPSPEEIAATKTGPRWTK